MLFDFYSEFSMRIQCIFKLIIIMISLGFSTFTFALSLDEAKSKGLLGEQPDGYLGIVNTPTPELNSLKNNINQQRQALYQDIAKKNGTEISAVEQLAGKKAIEKAPPGTYVKSTDGQWQKIE
jgi:hypothetical protein